MARISGIDLPIGKRIEIALTYIFGIGRAKAHSILTRAKVDFGTKVRDLTEDEVGRIRRVINPLFSLCAPSPCDDRSLIRSLTSTLRAASFFSPSRCLRCKAIRHRRRHRRR